MKDDSESSNDTSTEITPNKADTDPVDTEYLFESDAEGVKEFMRCTKKVDGTHEWVYFSAKNTKEVKLGVRKEAGFEVVYFQAKPKELYWVYVAECGFNLSDEARKTSQWYGQVKPRCADNMFEN